MKSGLTKEVTRYALKHHLRARCEHYPATRERIYSLVDVTGEMIYGTHASSVGGFMHKMRRYVLAQG